MQTAISNTQGEARNSWLSAYPYEILHNGLGARIACTASSGTSSRTALVYPTEAPASLPYPNTATITNVGSVVGYVALGTSSVEGTTSCYPILPGTKETVTIPSNASWTHAAGITDTGTTTLLIHLGFGN